MNQISFHLLSLLILAFLHPTINLVKHVTLCHNKYQWYAFVYTFFPRPPRLSFSFLDGFFDAAGVRPLSGCLASDLRELDGFLGAGLAACSSLLTGLGAGRTFL